MVGSTLCRWAAGVCIGMLMAGMARAGSLDPSLSSRASADPGADVPVIIEFSQTADLRDLRINGSAFPGSKGVLSPRAAKARKAERTLKRRLMVQRLKAHAGREHSAVRAWLGTRKARRMRSLWATNRVAAVVPAGSLTALAAQPGVRRIVLDAVVLAPATASSQVAAPSWNLTAIGASSLWALGIEGGGVVVASMDTGVDGAHPDLAPSYRGGTNSWLDVHGEHVTPYDHSGHGTQVMGLMVGKDSSGFATGVAPGARWIAAKIFSDAGQALVSEIHVAFEWLLDPDGDLNTDDAPDVVNNSWGFAVTQVCDNEFAADIQLLRDAGISVAFAAGNEGASASSTTSPGNNAGVFAVGATDAGNVVPAFSGRGPSACDLTSDPDVAAPGVSVYTTDRSFAGMPFYASVSGTSFATPHVSGLMALLKSAFPLATPSQIDDALRFGAQDIDASGLDNASGYGLINAWGAYQVLTGIFGDADTDGIADLHDNCINRSNADQRDTNGDGYGNRCDGDLDNNGVTNVTDWNRFKFAYQKQPGQSGYLIDADFDGNGVVNVVDANYFKGVLYSKPPGPSGVAP